MTTINGLDYAWGRIPGHVLKAAGIEFVCRYLSHDQTKNLNVPEVADLHGAGIGIVLVWEDSATAALGGFGAGKRDAEAAAALGRKLAVPADVPIYFAVDFPVELSQLPTVADYFRGVEQVIGYGRTGVYGGLAAIQGVLGKYAKWGWQTYAWSGGRVHAGAQLYQYSNDHAVAGVSCDFNRALLPEYGAWVVAEHEKPHGTARFSGYVDLAAGRWEVGGSSNTLRDRVAGEEAHFGAHGGHWAIDPLPAEPGDIWAAKLTLRRGDLAA